MIYIFGKFQWKYIGNYPDFEELISKTKKNLLLCLFILIIAIFTISFALIFVHMPLHTMLAEVFALIVAIFSFIYFTKEYFLLASGWINCPSNTSDDVIRSFFLLTMQNKSELLKNRRFVKIAWNTPSKNISYRYEKNEKQ